MSTSKLDEIRQSVLDGAQKSERKFYQAVAFFAVLEVVVWGIYITLAVMEFSTAVLVGTAAACVYIIVAFGLLGLYYHINACTRRMLQAIELLSEAESDGTESE
jgi:uncharacterized Tic20 family protein